MHEIKDELLLLSSMVEQAVVDSAAALRDNDVERARQIHANDAYMGRKRFEIEYSILILIATQQPVADDLRFLTSCLDICTELDGMGDYAKAIANINMRSEGLNLPRILRDFYSMAERAVDMLHRAMTAFINEDAETAKAMILEDDVIDECYSKLYHGAIQSIISDPRNIERFNYVIWTAHNLKRFGDRVTNICERIVYIATGERLESDTLPQNLNFSVREYKW